MLNKVTEVDRLTVGCYYRVQCVCVRMQPGGRCPHRGTPLNAVAPDENGAIHCPAHGLKWAATGELISIDTTAK